jgi:uncharacterized membrane protein (TIGR02234 family)
VKSLGRARNVVGLVVLLAGLLVVTASRTWVTGRAKVDVVGSRDLVATGSQAAPGLVALALLAAAAVLAAATSGPVGRRIALVLLTVASGGLVLTVARVLPRRDELLGEIGARAAGHTGTVPVAAALGPWVWVALAAAVLLLAGSVLGWLGAGTWRGLSDRYSRTEETVSGARGERVGSDWDRLSSGDDPTA